MRAALRVAATELVAVRREWLSMAGYAFIALTLGLGPWGVDAAQDRLAPDEPESAEEADDEGGSPCDTDAAVATVGPMPAWASAGTPVASVDGADVLVRVGERDGRPELEVVALDDDAVALRVARCLREQRRAERRSRLAGVGVTEEPESLASVVRVDDLAAREEASLPESSPGGLLGLGAVFMLALGIFAEMAPRARTSGYLEALAALPIRARDVALGYWLAGAAVSAGWSLVAVGVFALCELLRDGPGVDAQLLLVPLAVPPIAALAHRLSAGVEDLRAAAFRTFWIMFVFCGLLGASVATWLAAPTLAATIPIGGLALALLGWTTPAQTALAVASAAAGTVALLWSTTRLIAELDLGAGAVDGAEARRAAGDYRPEALLLFLVGTAGSTAWVPQSLMTYPIAAVLLTQVAFFGMPALWTPKLLRLPARELLQLRRAPLRTVVAPGIAVGTLALAFLALAIADRVLGFDRGVMEEYGVQMGQLGGPLGIVAVALAPALCEELLYRGAILGLLRRRGRTWGPVVLQAALFGLAHVLAFKVAVAFPLGLLLGVLAVRTRSIWPGVVVHALHNGAAMAGASIGFAGDPAELDGQAMAALAALALMGAGLAWWTGGGNQGSGGSDVEGR